MQMRYDIIAAASDKGVERRLPHRRIGLGVGIVFRNSASDSSPKVSAAASPFRELRPFALGELRIDGTPALWHRHTLAAFEAIANAFEQVELKVGVVHLGEQSDESIETEVIVGASRTRASFTLLTISSGDGKALQVIGRR